MIFTTVGTQLPFDRLIQSVDEVAPFFPNTEFIVQACRPKYKPRHVKTYDLLSPADFEAYMQTAELIISHAGVGTMFTAGRYRKPMIFCPRQGSLREHRNNHQVDTVNRLQHKFPLNIANNAEDLKILIGKFYAGDLEPMPQLPAFASTELLDSLRWLLNGEETVGQPSLVSVTES